MSTTTPAANLVLAVNDPGRLLQGCTATYRFGPQGGTIGRDGDWRLLDRKDHIQAIHCEIRWYENSFCVIGRSADIRMNGSDKCLAPGSRVRLKVNDSLRIGDYLIVVQSGTAPSSPYEHSLSELLNGRTCPLQALSRSAGAQLHDQQRVVGHAELDPLTSLNLTTQALADPTLTELFGIATKVAQHDQETP